MFFDLVGDRSVMLKLAAKLFREKYPSWVGSGMLFMLAAFNNAFADLAEKGLHYQAAINIAAKSAAPTFTMGVSAAPFRFTLESSASSKRIPDPGVLKYTQQRFSLMGNIYYDFLPGAALISPYIGVGAGVSKFKNTLETSAAMTKQSQSALSFQGISGLKLQLSEQAALTVDYRYCVTPKVNINSNQRKTKGIHLGVLFTF